MKERRLDFLYSCWNQELQTVVRYFRLALECTGEFYQWLAEVFICDCVKPAQKKIRKIRWEIDMWNNPELIVLGRFSAEDIERAKEVDWSLFLEVNRRDINRTWFLCPFHKEKIPSFCYFKDSHQGHCFSCGWHGSGIDLIIKLYNLDFVEAVNYILRRR